MRTRSSSNLIVESSTILNRRNRRRSKQIVEPEIRSIVENPVVTMVDMRTMSKLLQPSTEGYGDAIVIPAILAENFELKGAARIWLEKEPPRSILTWEDLVSKFVNYFFPPSKTTNLKNDITNFQQKYEEMFSEAWDRFKELLHSLNAVADGNLLNHTPRDALTVIENKLKVRTSRNKPIVLKVSTTSSSSPSPDITALTDIVKELVLMNKANQQASVKVVDEICVTCGGPHPYYECLATDSNTFNAYAATGTYNQGGSGSIPSNTVANPRGDVKAITTRSGVAYDGPTIPPTTSPLPKEVERETEATKDKVQTTSSESTAHVQPSVVQIPIPEPEVAPKLHFDISFADALLHMPKFASTFKSLLSNKEKLFELANTPLNGNCLAVLLKQLPEKFGEPGKFLIPCDFSELDECLALADLGASINLMPLFVWKKLSLPELTPTRMTLELADRSVAHLKGVAEYVFVKVGKFYFPADFVVVDYDVDHRVPLILGRPFLRTARALIDVHGEELTLQVNDEAITFKVGHTSRYSLNVIDVACEEYAQEALGFLDSSTSGNPTPSDPIIASSFPLLTPFEGGDFILEEIKACLSSDSIPPGIDDADFDLEGDIRILGKLLNDDPLSPLPPKELNYEELKTIKSSIDDPPELELKDLPSHFEYAFLEGTDKLPVIISKELKDEEKAALLKVLKSHKWAIAWKISDIKGIDPRFYYIKITNITPQIRHRLSIVLRTELLRNELPIRLHATTLDETKQTAAQDKQPYHTLESA
ncbi:reverse transcriptase domain-containing protein [Tanacetum coccineum]